MHGILDDMDRDDWEERRECHEKKGVTRTPMEVIKKGKEEKITNSSFMV